MPDLSRYEMTVLSDLLERLRQPGDDYVIVSIGRRGPNLDCEIGNAVATVRMGNDEATSEALYLDDAISLARAKIIRARAAKKAKEEKDRK